MEKKKYELDIAGVNMSIISDEREDFVLRLATELDTSIKAITESNKRCSTLDAAILTALEYASDKIKSEKRVRNLEAQVALYDANLRRMKEENARLKGESFVGVPKASEDEPSKIDEPSEIDDLKALDGSDETDSELATEACASEPLIPETDVDDEPAAEAKAADCDETTDKLRRIEDLFRRRSESSEHASDNEKREDKLRQIESLLKGKEN